VTGSEALPAGGAVAIIPARLASSRFPAKAVADRTGRPLVQHVAEAAARAASIGRVVVAADDERVAAAVRCFGTEVVLTRVDHPNGTSRLDEAAALLGLADDAVVVNVQGDEPEIEPGVIDAAVAALSGSGEAMATVVSPFAAGEDPANPNIVKAVVRTGADGWRRAVYFSRALIPHCREGGERAAEPLKHVGLYAYRRGFLRRYVSLPATPLERTEMLEQLRAIEHGHAIAAAVERTAHHGIDTPEQYEAFVARWRARHG
jgi:3-deoxy-manno-octulosonate cytidylyltransferase (CMP-KDO synthetase)